MSEEEKFKDIVQEINEIYVFLTQREPTPDEEIEARENLIEKIKTIITLNASQVGANMRLFETALSKLENWDTLDLWFIESGLPEVIQKVINLDDSLPEFQIIEESKEEPILQSEKDSETNRFDINEIVSKVSEQFKGEIDGLKEKIGHLEHELERKEETLKKSPSKKVVKTIRPKKNVKLPPPKIKIPVIKPPEKPPQINIVSKQEPEKPKIKSDISAIERVQAKIEEELQKLATTPIFEEESTKSQEIPKKPESIVDILEESTPLPPAPEPKFKVEKPKEPESILDILEETSPLPPAPEFNAKPEQSKEPYLISALLEEIGPLPTSSGADFLSEIPKGLESDIDILDELGPLPPPPKSDTLSDLPKNLPKLEIPEKISSDSEKIGSEEQELKFPEPSVLPEKPEVLKRTSLISEVLLTESEADQQKTIIPFIPKNPKITSVSVEEIETESMKSSGTDLFNVFSSVGDNKKKKKPTKNLELLSTIPTKEKKKKEVKKKKKDEDLEPNGKPTQFIGFSSTKEEPPSNDELEPFSIEELPTDKDSLYQELIALEGKRYSIEKNYKEIEKKFSNGSIDEIDFKKQNDELKIKLDEITSRINKIRRVISSI